MARVRLLDENAGPKAAAVVKTIRGARGGRLLNLYRVLLHSPELASAWLEFNNAVRFQSGLDVRLRELVIIRIAYLNRADYVVDIHRSRYAEAAGVTPGEVDALAAWNRYRLFSRAERAALRYTDAVTRDVTVPNGVYNRLRGQYDERAIVELTVLIATYNMHTRLLRALDIDPETA